MESESSLVRAAILMYAIVILTVFSLFRQLNQMKSRSQYIYLAPSMLLFLLNVYKLDYAFITRAYAFPPASTHSYNVFYQQSAERDNCWFVFPRGTRTLCSVGPNLLMFNAEVGGWLNLYRH